MAEAEFYVLALPCKKLSWNKPHDKLCAFMVLQGIMGDLRKFSVVSICVVFFYASVLTDDMQCLYHSSSKVVNSYVI